MNLVLLDGERKKNLSASFLFSLFWVSVLPVIFITWALVQIRDVWLQMHPIVKEKAVLKKQKKTTWSVCNIWYNRDGLKSTAAWCCHQIKHWTFSNVLAYFRSARMNLEGFYEGVCWLRSDSSSEWQRWVLPTWLISDLMCFLTNSVFLQRGGKLLCDICKVTALLGWGYMF